MTAIILSAMLFFIVLLVATSTVVIGHPRAGHHNSRSRYLMRQPSCRTDLYRKTSQNSCVKVYEIFPVEIKVLKDDEELDKREIRHLIKKEIRSLQRLLQEFDPMPYSHSLIDDLIDLCCSYKRPETSSKYEKNNDDNESDDSEDETEDEEDESETLNETEHFTNNTTVIQPELPRTNSTSNPVEKPSFKLEITVEDETETTQSDSDATDAQTMTQETTSQPTENPWTTRLEPINKTHRPLTTKVDDAFDPSTDDSQYDGLPQDQTESDASRRPKTHKHPQTTQVDDMDSTRHPSVPWFFPESDSQYGDDVLDKTNQKAYDRINSNPTKHPKKKHQSQRDATRQIETKRHGNAKKLTKH